ncbi:MAG: zf-TFIIB domain-containing protein [bacterium]
MSSTVKPSHEEEEYFARQEIEKRQALAEKLREQMQAAELENLKKLHWNHCARCGFEMHSVVFKGVTIEKCPNCGGIFLDAGEIEQIAGKESGFIGSVLGLFKF